MEIKTLAELKQALRAGPHAFPGGYPCYFITHDCEALSFKAVRDNLRQVMYAIWHNHTDGWRVIGVDINYEDTSLYCAHTNERIEAAYED